MPSFKGYRSAHIGPQDMKGPAVDAMTNAVDHNRAGKVDVRRWLGALTRGQKRFDAQLAKLFRD